MPLPHFNSSKAKTYPDPVLSSHFDVIIYTSLGKEIESLTIPSIHIDEVKNHTTIKCCINSSSEAIADYKTLSTIKYVYFRIKDRRNQSLKQVIYNVSLMGVQCKFDYSLDSSIQENECTFTVINSHDLDNDNVSPDDIIRKIIRGEKIDNILD